MDNTSTVSEAPTSRSYLVTGGAGFIGSHIASSLVARGDRVRIIDNLITGNERNLDGFRDKIDFVNADLRDFDSIRAAFDGVTHVFHQAAIPSVPRSIAEPRLNHEANANGTFNVLVAARDAQVKRVVYAASSSVYGGTVGLPKREDMAPAPLSPYAAAKLVGEYYGQAFAASYGLEMVSLRYFNVFGPRQDPTSAYSGVISKFITALLAGENPVVYGDGEQTRDFTYIDHVVDANLRAAEMPEACGQVMNIGTGKRTSLNTLLEILQNVIGTNLKPSYRAARGSEPRDSEADISRARSLLGFRPDLSFEEGLRRTVEWYRSES